MGEAARALVARARLDPEAWALLHRVTAAWVEGYEAALEEYADPDLHPPVRREQIEELALEAIAKASDDAARAVLLSRLAL